MPRATASTKRKLDTVGADIAATITERQFQDNVLALARVYGWKVLHIRPVRVTRKDGTVYHETPIQADGKGFPDLFMVRRERALAMELKAERGIITVEQVDWIWKLAASGIEAFVFRPSQMDMIEELLR